MRSKIKAAAAVTTLLLVATQPAAAAPSLPANLPGECKALIAKLQACSAHLDAVHSPNAPQIRMAVQGMLDTLPRAPVDAKLVQSCKDGLARHDKTAPRLGC